MRELSINRIVAIALTVAVIAIVFMQSIAVLRLKHELREVKWAMKTQIIQSQSDGEFQRFSFTNSEWKSLFKPDPTEFVFQGHYYDIAFIEQESNGIVVKCLKDEKETVMKKQLRTWMDQDNSPYSKTKEKGNVYKVLSKLVLTSVSNEDLILLNPLPKFSTKNIEYSFICSNSLFRPPIG